MKFRLLSDLHTEGYGYSLKSSEEDRDSVCILAGDIGNFKQEGNLKAVLTQASEMFKEVVYFPGNHEFYGSEFNETKERLSSICCSYSNVHFLDDSALSLGSLRIIGSTLWSSLELASHRDRALISTGIADFSRIKLKSEDSPLRRFRIADMMAQFQNSIKFIERELSICRENGYTAVVATHFVPCLRSISDKFKGDAISRSLNHYFTTDLSELIIKYEPVVWCHGHTHDAYDYQEGPTRIICNPKGYRHEALTSGFDPLKSFEV